MSKKKKKLSLKNNQTTISSEHHPEGNDALEEGKKSKTLKHPKKKQLQDFTYLSSKLWITRVFFIRVKYVFSFCKYVNFFCQVVYWLEFTFFKVNSRVSGVRTSASVYNNACPCQLSLGFAHGDCQLFILIPIKKFFNF